MTRKEDWRKIKQGLQIKEAQSLLRSRQDPSKMAKVVNSVIWKMQNSVSTRTNSHDTKSVSKSHENDK